MQFKDFSSKLNCLLERGQRLKAALQIVLTMAATVALLSACNKSPDIHPGPQVKGVNDSTGGDIPQSSAEQVRKSFESMKSHLPESLERLKTLTSDLMEIENSSSVIPEDIKQRFAMTSNEKIIYRFTRNIADPEQFLKQITIVLSDHDCKDGLQSKDGSYSRETKKICINSKSIRRLTSDSLNIEILALLYHELSHAVDYSEPEAQELQQSIRESRDFIFKEHTSYSRNRMLSMAYVINKLSNSLWHRLGKAKILLGTTVSSEDVQDAEERIYSDASSLEFNLYMLMKSLFDPWDDSNLNLQTRHWSLSPKILFEFAKQIEIIKRASKTNESKADVEASRRDFDRLLDLIYLENPTDERDIDSRMIKKVRILNNSMQLFDYYKELSPVSRAQMRTHPNIGCVAYHNGRAYRGQLDQSRDLNDSLESSLGNKLLKFTFLTGDEKIKISPILLAPFAEFSRFLNLQVETQKEYTALAENIDFLAGIFDSSLDEDIFVLFGGDFHGHPAPNFGWILKDFKNPSELTRISFVGGMLDATKNKILHRGYINSLKLKTSFNEFKKDTRDVVSVVSHTLVYECGFSQ